MPWSQEQRDKQNMELVVVQDSASLPDTARRAYHRMTTNIRSNERTAAWHPPQARRDTGDEPIAAEVMGMGRIRTEHLSDEEIERGLAVWSEKAALALDGLALTWASGLMAREEDQLDHACQEGSKCRPGDPNEGFELVTQDLDVAANVSDLPDNLDLDVLDFSG